VPSGWRSSTVLILKFLAIAASALAIAGIILAIVL
jgi:hypothetical protein